MASGLAEQGVAPAVGFRKPSPGTPRVTVRPTTGAAFSGWTGPDEGRRKPPGSREGHPSGPAPEARSRGCKRHKWSAGRRACRSHGTRRLRKVPDVAQRLSALRSLTGVREGRGRRTQKRVYARLRRAMADQTMGTMNHVCCLKTESGMEARMRNAFPCPREEG